MRYKILLIKALALLLFLFFSITGICQTVQYHPTPEWTDPIPKKKPSKNTFEIYNIEPQYGYQKEHAAEWVKWKATNQLPIRYRLGGHMWQAFIRSNASIFTAHPEYLAEVNGIRKPYPKNNKLCVSNPDVQRLFIAFILQQFAKAPDKDVIISVSPSDGPGFCTCEQCRKLGNISNQVFYLANLTAKEVRNVYPTGKVSLQAYYMHALPPSFELEPNVWVVVIPTGFQDQFHPDNILQLWAQKTSNLVYRDYVNIPQWNAEVPKFNYQPIIDRTLLAYKLKYKGIWHESSSNILNSIFFIILKQAMDEFKGDWKAAYDQFLTQMFPHTKTTVGKVLNAWWFDAAHARDKTILHLLAQASNAARENAEQRRVADLYAYAQYAALINQARKTDNPKAWTTVKDFLEEVDDRLLVNPYALQRVLPQLKQAAITQAPSQRLGIKAKDPRKIPLMQEQSPEQELKVSRTPEDVLEATWSRRKKQTDSVVIPVRNRTTFYVKGSGPLELDTRLFKSTKEIQFSIKNLETEELMTKVIKPGERFLLEPSKAAYRITIHNIFQGPVVIRGNALAFIPLAQEMKTLLLVKASADNPQRGMDMLMKKSGWQVVEEGFLNGGL